MAPGKAVEVRMRNQLECHGFPLLFPDSTREREARQGNLDVFHIICTSFGHQYSAKVPRFIPEKPKVEPQQACKVGQNSQLGENQKL